MQTRLSGVTVDTTTDNPEVNFEFVVTGDVEDQRLLGRTFSMAVPVKAIVAPEGYEVVEHGFKKKE